MAENAAYELLDFGGGRKLEQFGPYRIDRPAPAADHAARRAPQSWAEADARYERLDAESGRWTMSRPIADFWPVRLGPFTLELKLTQFGHLGVFMEQADNWRWIADQVHAAGRIKVLNLFAYTGASTLAAAAAGAEVVHVDAAANVVAWARRNASASGLEQAPIRWIVEDAPAFVRRELKRGNQYDAVILDPPAYGHGPKRQNWKLESGLEDLLAECVELMSGRERFLLLTCHSGALGEAAALREYFHSQRRAWCERGSLASDAMTLKSAAGGRLSAGAALRWSGTPRLHSGAR
jgi:23S rRNA (cytosine1962-C5)-methyltransferase